MPTYTGTNAFSQLDVTTPLGTGAPHELDDAIREIKLVLKTALTNSLSDKGGVRVATWKYMSAAQITTGTLNQWNRLPLSVLSDPCSIIGAGDYTNSVKPIVGTYIVDFFGKGISCGLHQARVAQATGNTTAPSSSNAITDLVGGIMASSNTATYEFGNSIGYGILVADGLKSYCLDFICAAAGYLNLAAGTNGLSGPIAGVRFTFLGTVVP